MLASEPVCIVGVDVAAPDQVRSKGRALSDAELQATFRRQLSGNRVSSRLDVCGQFVWGTVDERRSSSRTDGMREFFPGRRRWMLRQGGEPRRRPNW